MCIFVLLYGISEVAPNIAGYSDYLFVLVPYAVGIVEVTGQALAGYYFFLVFAVVLSFGYILVESHKELIWFKLISIVVLFPVLIYMLAARLRQLKALTSKLSFQAPTRSNSNTFFLLAQIFLAVLFFDYLWYFIVESAGAETHAPAFEESPLWENLFGFLRASVWEEIVSRILLIGFPLLVYKFVQTMADGRLGDTLQDRGKAMRKAGRLLFGGHGDFQPVTVGLIIFSSLMFGFAHALGWDMWKVVQTFVSGLAFGYLFVKCGVHACVTLHFSFNYLGVTLDYLPADVMTQMSVMLIFFLWLAVGMVYFVYYAVKALRFFVVSDDSDMGEPPEIAFTKKGKYLVDIFGLPKARRRRTRVR
jgi:hypothetical protein